MSQKEIKLYDNSFIKLTIKQGTEQERFPVTIGSGQFLKENDLLDFVKINSVSGALVSGELGYTRDTHRLFVGNISKTLKGSQQQTLGGTLVGNKYLGFVDSRNDKKLNDPTPISLSELLSETSEYRSYNFSDHDSDGLIKTEDGKWQRLPYYNSKYDAYDGDYMYDMYRNAIILFDHNITSSNNPSFSNGKLTPTMRGKRKTIFEPCFEGKTLEGGEITVNSHTKDMYGDGYVLFYNVIPDGDTLTFADKSFNSKGKDNNELDTNNYSYNIIKINRIPTEALLPALDTDYFEISRVSETETVISLSSEVKEVLFNLVANNSAFAFTNISETDLSWINANLNEDTLKNTIESLVLKPAADATHYVTNEDVQLMLDNSINENNTNISIRTNNSVPDYSRSAECIYTVIDESSIKELFPQRVDNEETPQIEGESDDEWNKRIKEDIYYMSISGEGEMSLTHTYNGSGNFTMVLGKDGVYTQHLLPFNLSSSEEKYVISGGTNVKIYIIPEK